MSDWELRLKHEREQKDAFFTEHPQSPIPPSERDHFGGLEYYPPDQEYWFEVPLHEFDEPEPMTIETTQEGEQTTYAGANFTLESTVKCTH